MLAVEKRKQSYEEYYGHYFDHCYVDDESNRRIRSENKISTGQKAKLLLGLLLLGALCICIIITSAYTSEIKYRINKGEDQIASLEKEIENIQITIQQSNEINRIEAKAMNDLGMIYPTSDQVVFLNNTEIDDADFGALLKIQAFN